MLRLRGLELKDSGVYRKLSNSKLNYAGCLGKMFFFILLPLPGQDWATIGRSENVQPRGMTVH